MEKEFKTISQTNIKIIDKIKINYDIQVNFN